MPGVILCHGFPIGPLDARQSAGTFPELIDRMANELGWAAMTFNFRGCGNSEGDFSLQGWVDDLRAAIDYLIQESGPTGIWLVGTNTGGSVVTCVAADDPRVRGAALLSPRADFDDWAAPMLIGIVKPLKSARRVFRRRSTSGHGSCVASARSTRPAGLRRDHSW